jgi:hypothetical protein
MGIKTWNFGDVPTAADFNTYVRDLAQTALCVARGSGTQTVAPDTTTGVLLAGTEDADTDGMHSTSVATNLFVPVYEGFYMISGFVFVAANTTFSYTQITVLKNAVADVTNSGWGYGFARDQQGNGTFANALPICSVPVWCNGTTDNLQVAVGFDSAGDRNIDGACVSCWRLMRG